jgi:hypothetical protein
MIMMPITMPALSMLKVAKSGSSFFNNGETNNSAK